MSLVSVATWAQGLRRFLRIPTGLSLDVLETIQPSFGLDSIPDELLADFGFTPFHWGAIVTGGGAGTFAQAQLVCPSASRVIAVIGNWDATTSFVIGIGPQIGAAAAGFTTYGGITVDDFRQTKTIGGTSSTAVLSFQAAQVALGANTELEQMSGGSVQYAHPRIVMPPGSSVFIRQLTATAALQAGASGYYRQFEDTELNV
jgi:hypothetical protein